MEKVLLVLEQSFQHRSLRLKELGIPKSLIAENQRIYQVKADSVLAHLLHASFSLTCGLGFSYHQYLQQETKAVRWQLLWAASPAVFLGRPQRDTGTWLQGPSLQLFLWFVPAPPSKSGTQLASLNGLNGALLSACGTNTIRCLQSTNTNG